MVYSPCINNKMSNDNCCILCKKNGNLSIELKKCNHIYCIQCIKIMKEQRRNIINNCPVCIKDVSIIFLNVTHHKKRKMLASKL